MLPISSTAAGSSSSTATVASIDSSSESKWSTASAFSLGMGTVFSFDSVTVTSVPSEPTTNRAMSKPPPESSSRLYPDTRRWILG